MNDMQSIGRYPAAPVRAHMAAAMAARLVQWVMVLALLLSLPGWALAEGGGEEPIGERDTGVRLVVDLATGRAVINTAGLTLNGFSVKSRGPDTVMGRGGDGYLAQAAVLPPSQFQTNTVDEASVTFVAVTGEYEVGQLVAPAALPRFDIRDLAFGYTVQGQHGVRVGKIIALGESPEAEEGADAATGDQARTGRGGDNGAGGRTPATTPTSRRDLLDFRQTIRQAKDRVFPSVVFIRCVVEDMQSGRKESQEVTGSGVLISAEGEVLTNWHVVDKAVEIRCLLFDGRAFTAEKVGEDKDTDLALIRLTEESLAGRAQSRETEITGLPFAPFGDSEALTEGDFVMAMGAPWGMSRSVSIGIISCTSRYLPEASQYSLWLQTDAAISPGNSGGPLVDTEGRIIGINTRGTMAGGDLGFAIPIDTVKQVLPQLREGGKVEWTWTGLQLQPLRDFNRNTYFEGEEGVIVAGTDPESPARRAGILARDRILAIGREPVTAVTDEDLPAVRRRLGMLAKGESVSLLILRGEERKRITMTPRAKGDVEGQEQEFPRWDFTAKQINQFDNPDLHYFRKEGVFVFGVKYPGNAANAGLAQNDIIVRVAGREVTTLEDLKAAHAKAIEDMRKSTRVVMQVLRNGQLRVLVLEFSRDHEKD